MFLGHELQTIEVIGTHSSPDEKWNNAHVTYWATSDLVAENGSQRGYYVTEHPDGGRSTFVYGINDGGYGMREFPQGGGYHEQYYGYSEVVRDFRKRLSLQRATSGT